MAPKNVSDISLDELLAFDEDRAAEAVSIMWSRLEEKNEESLNDSEELFLLVRRFLANLDDDGFAYFFTTQGARAKELATALTEIGAMTMHLTLRRAMTVFPGADVPTEEDEVERLLELVDGEDELWEELDQDYQETRPDEVEKCLLTFMSDNRRDF